MATTKKTVADGNADHYTETAHIFTGIVFFSTNKKHWNNLKDAIITYTLKNSCF